MPRPRHRVPATYRYGSCTLWERAQSLTGAFLTLTRGAATPHSAQLLSLCPVAHV